MSKSPSQPNFTLEQGFYWLALGLAVLYRLVLLGESPLSASEAGWAMRAWHLASGTGVDLGSQPAYVLFTGFIFRFFGSNEFAARLLPAMAGTLLVGLPWFWREKFGRLPALLFAFGLAFEPSLIAASRVVGGPMPAVFFLMAAVTAWFARVPHWAGVALALALMSGPATWLGILIALLAFLIIRISTNWRPELDIDQLPRLGLALGFTALFAGTFFLRDPQGISALASGFTDFLSGWGQTSDLRVPVLLLAWLVYQPFSLIFALVGFAYLLQRDGTKATLLVIWGLTAIVVVLLYPGRAVLDLVWVSVPALFLSAYAFSYLLDWQPSDGFVAWGQMSLVFCFLAFAWLDIASLVSTYDPDQARLRIYIALGVIAITFLSTALVGIGWDRRQAVRGLGWGCALFLLIYGLSVAWTSTHIADRVPHELWQPVPASGLNRQLAAQVQHLSELNIGHADGLDIVALTQSKSLEWLLRDYPRARFADQLAVGELPSIVLSGSDANNPFLQTSYRGEGFAWSIYPLGFDEEGFDFLRWFFLRDAPTINEELILWARGDAFPSGSLIPAGASAPTDSGSVDEGDLVPDVGQ
jgi:hypothetical protein